MHYLREDECRRVAASGRWRGPEDDDQEPDEIDLEGMEHEAATSSCSGVALGSRFGNVGDVHQSSRDARAQIVPAMKLPPSAERVLRATTQGGGVTALPTQAGPEGDKKKPGPRPIFNRGWRAARARLGSMLDSSALPRQHKPWPSRPQPSSRRLSVPPSWRSSAASMRNLVALEAKFAASSRGGLSSRQSGQGSL